MTVHIKNRLTISEKGKNLLIEQCNICGERVKKLYDLTFIDIFGMADQYEQHICYCEKCGFIFTSNPFSEQQLSKRYKTFSKYEFDDPNSIYKESSSYLKRCRRQRHFLYDSIVDFHQEIESILEIGAASGYNLSIYKNDCRVEGVEPSKKNCSLAKTLYGVHLFSGTFQEFYQTESKKSFDLIFLSHVLEHIVNPFDFLQQCKKYNNKYFFIEVPTFDFKFIDEPYGMFGEEHVNFFTYESLSSLMNHAGYELLNANIILGGGRIPGWLPDGLQYLQYGLKQQAL